MKLRSCDLIGVLPSISSILIGLGFEALTQGLGSNLLFLLGFSCFLDSNLMDCCLDLDDVNFVSFL